MQPSDAPDQEKKMIVVRNYDGAFHIYILGQSLSDWVFDILSLFGFWLVIFWALGEFWLISSLYEALKEAEWSFLVYLVAPLIITGLMLFFKERGLTVWAWLFNRWMQKVEQKKDHVPFDKPDHPYY